MKHFSIVCILFFLSIPCLSADQFELIHRNDSGGRTRIELTKVSFYKSGVRKPVVSTYTDKNGILFVRKTDTVKGRLIGKLRYLDKNFEFPVDVNGSKIKRTITIP